VQKSDKFIEIRSQAVVRIADRTASKQFAIVAICK